MEILFDDKTHSYFVDGFMTSSVNEILNAVYGSGLEGVPVEFVQRAAAKGTLVHGQIADLIKALKLKKFPQDFEGYFNDKRPEVKYFAQYAERFLTIKTYAESEKILFAKTPFGNFCGTADLFCGGVIYDYKTSNTATKAQILHWQKQLSFYFYAYKQMGRRPLGMVVLHLTEKGCISIPLDYLGDEFVENTVKAYKEGISLKEEKPAAATELQTVSPTELVQFADLMRQIKVFEAAAKEIKERIKDEMEKRNILSLSIGNVLITCTAASKRRDFDKAKFKAEHPDLYNAYISETPVASSIRIKVK